MIAQVKVLYIRNLRSDVNEASLKEKFESYGPIERVKRVKSYGFVHFSTRELALQAMEELNGTVSVPLLCCPILLLTLPRICFTWRLAVCMLELRVKLVIGCS